jgi:hypothetical protein
MACHDSASQWMYNMTARAEAISSRFPFASSVSCLHYINYNIAQRVPSFVDNKLSHRLNNPTAGLDESLRHDDNHP